MAIRIETNDQTLDRIIKKDVQQCILADRKLMSYPNSEFEEFYYNTIIESPKHVSIKTAYRMWLKENFEISLEGPMNAKIISNNPEKTTLYKLKYG